LADAKLSPRDELGRDAFHQAEAMDWITDNPTRFLQSCWVRQQRFWRVFPIDQNRIVELAVALFYSTQFLFVGIGLFRAESIKRNPAIVVIVVSIALLHAFYWSNTRMRAPIQPFLALIAVSVVQKNLNSSQNT
jgi:hypothetical protein